MFSKENPMNLKGMVRAWLREYAFDGLVHPDGECGCDINNLMHCVEACDCDRCLPGYKGPDPSGEFDYLIYQDHDAREAAKAEAIRNNQ